jgi:Bardet-Biedl syndrome 7 protein
LQEFSFEAVPTALTYFPLSHDVFNQHPTRKEIFVGFSNGDLIQVFLDKTSHFFGSSLFKSGGTISAPITQLYSGFDMSQDGFDDIVVGRDDGNVEIYHMDPTGRLFKARRLHFPFSRLLVRRFDS